MNRAELIKRVSKEANITKKEARKAIDSLLNSISLALIEGKKVKIIGFGTFEVKKVKRRIGRNPQTGGSIKIRARAIPSFRASSRLKEAVSSGLPGVKNIPLYTCPKPPPEHFTRFIDAEDFPKDGKCPKHHVKLVKVE